MRQVGIIGILGNMGHRYKAILDYLQVEVCGVDLGYTYRHERFEECDGFIIATPTDMHLDDLERFANYEKPILCEKPITRGRIDKVKNGELITMVNQYAYLYDKNSRGETYYDYFKTGRDTIFWDCINIIGLSCNHARLNNTSPIWKCAINGRELSIADMDRAYVKMLMDWTLNHESNWDYAVYAHDKVLRWMEK